jgi:hypothetical protein
VTDDNPKGTNGYATQITTDHGGVKRLQFKGCKIGAFEHKVPRRR